VDGVGVQLAFIAFLIALNAILSGSEIALISLREGQLVRLERHSAAGRAVGRLARDPNRFLSTIQIGITLTGFLASATAALTLAEPLVEPLSFLGGAARPSAVFLVTLGLTLVTLVVGELAPKRLAMQRSESWALLAARPLAGLARLVAPAVWVLSHATNATVRLLGGDPGREREEVTEAEIRDLVAAQRAYHPEHRRIIDRALGVGDRTLGEVLVPRGSVLALPEDLDVPEALRQLSDAGHNRAPVFRHDLDDAHRHVSVLGLVGRTGTVGDHAQPVVALPEAIDAVSALRELQARHQKLALVISEHGGVEGIVTDEDLVEELVGEIYDEHDPRPQDVVHLEGGAVLVPGRLPVHELAALGVVLPPCDAATVGGAVAERLRRMPEPGDVVVLGDYRLQVLETRKRVAHRVRIEAVADRGRE
jgi:putative hemolysin